MQMVIGLKSNNNNKRQLLVCCEIWITYFNRNGTWAQRINCTTCTNATSTGDNYLRSEIIIRRNANQSCKLPLISIQYHYIFLVSILMSITLEISCMV